MKKAPKKLKSIEPYKSSIKIFGKIHTAEGSSVQEAIANLAPPGVSRGMSILAVTKGDKTVDKILNTFQTSRLFSPARLVREIALKNTVMKFDI